VIRGAMVECERRGLITSADRGRLERVFEAFAASDQAAASSTILGVFDEAKADPEATPLALTACSIAAAHASAGMADELPGAVLGLADAGGCC
jgi:hypothetical protein